MKPPSFLKVTPKMMFEISSGYKQQKLSEHIFPSHHFLFFFTQKIFQTAHKMKQTKSILTAFTIIKCVLKYPFYVQKVLE